jgi:adenylate kinase family enzyme
MEYTPLFKWHCPQGIASNPQSIRKEFIKYRNLNSNKILVLGNPYTGKTELSNILSKIFHLPIINSKNIFDFGIKLANINNSNNESDENQFQGNQRKNSIEKDLIYDIQRTMKELDEGKAIAEENYNKRKDKKKTDPPFDDSMYYRFNDEMMVRILKRRLQENDTSIYGFILDGFPKNHHQAEEFFEDMNKGGMIPNSIIIFDNVEDDYIINRIKSSESFPKDAKDPQAAAILERANRRLNKIKDNKTEEGYKDLVEFFKDEKFANMKTLILDTKKEIIDIVKETQEFIISNNDNRINQIDEILNCTDYQYDYIKEQEELKRQKEEELKKENEGDEKNNKDKKGGEKDDKIIEEKNTKII